MLLISKRLLLAGLFFVGCTLATQNLCVAQDANAGQMAGVVIVDGVKYARTDVGIAAAVAGLNGPGEVKLSAGNYQISKEIVIATPGIRISGVGYGTRLRFNSPTLSMFRVTAPLFELSDVEISTDIEHTAGSVMEIEADQGQIQHIRIAGSFFNGFTMTTQKAGLWNFDDIRLVGGSTWNYVFLLRSPVNTIASTKLHNLALANSIRWKTAAIILDTGVDTFICSDSELGPILLQNSLKGQAPRWVRFTNAWTEGGNKAQNDKTDLQIDAVRDLRYIGGGLASARYGATVGAEARGVQITDTEFVNIYRSAVTVSSGANDVSLARNTFEDTGVESNGTYDTVSIAPGVGNIDVSYNSFKTLQGNRPRYNLALPAKCVSCVSDGNRYGGFQAGAVSNPK